MKKPSVSMLVMLACGGIYSLFLVGLMPVKVGEEALGTRKYSDFQTPLFCGTSCHNDIFQQWKQAMMSQAYTHHWDEIEYFGLAVPHGDTAHGDTHGDGISNEVFVWGGDLTLSLAEKLTLNVQYIQRRDENPYFNPAGDLTCKTRGAFAEAVWTPRGTDSKLYGALLWNWVDSDETPLDYHSLSAHSGFLLRRNLRLVAEITYVFKSRYGDNDGRHARTGIGLITAF